MVYYEKPEFYPKNVNKNVVVIFSEIGLQTFKHFEGPWGEMSCNTMRVVVVM